MAAASFHKNITISGSLVGIDIQSTAHRAGTYTTGLLRQSALLTILIQLTTQSTHFYQRFNILIEKNKNNNNNDNNNNNNKIIIIIIIMIIIIIITMIIKIKRRRRRRRIKKTTKKQQPPLTEQTQIMVTEKDRSQIHRASSGRLRHWATASPPLLTYARRCNNAAYSTTRRLHPAVRWFNAPSIRYRRST